MEEGTVGADRVLVQELMLRGWYRAGQDPPDATGRPGWRFRSGHYLEDPHRQTILVRARSPQRAMRAVLAHLQHNAGAARPDA